MTLSNGPSSRAVTYLLHILAIVILMMAPLSAGAQRPTDRDPQRHWAYDLNTHPITGAKYPAALLMSGNMAPLSERFPGLGNGYLSIEKQSGRPVEVVFSWDVPKPGDKYLDCQGGTCRVSVRFNSGLVIDSLATQRTLFPWEAVLKSGPEIISAARTQHGIIEIMFHQSPKDSGVFRFSTESKLQLEKLSLPAK